MIIDTKPMQVSRGCDAVVDRFYSIIPIEMCRTQGCCLVASNEAPRLLTLTETPVFVVDSIRRVLRTPLTTVIVDRDTLRTKIDQSYESFRARDVSRDSQPIAMDKQFFSCQVE